MTDTGGFSVDPTRLSDHSRRVSALAEATAAAVPRWTDLSPDAYGVLGTVLTGALLAPTTIGARQVARGAEALARVAGDLAESAASYRTFDADLTAEVCAVDVGTSPGRSGS